MTAREIAQHLKCDPASVRRWPARGCPVVSRGGRGPGRATQFDLDQVRRWRGRATAGPVGMMPDETLRVIAAAFLDCINNSGALRAGCEPEDAACLLFLAFETCCKAFNHRFPPGEQPAPIRALSASFIQ